MHNILLFSSRRWSNVQHFLQGITTLNQVIADIDQYQLCDVQNYFVQTAKYSDN
jgi:hypothetical protein